MLMSKLKPSYKVYMAFVTRKQLLFDDGIWIIIIIKRKKIELKFLAQL
jgi:hypothetical protein